MNKAFEIVTDYRNKAIAVLRLQKVNGLTQTLQELKSDLKGMQSDLGSTNQKIAEVNSGEFAPSFHDLERYGSADEARKAVLKDLGERAESLTKYLEGAQKRVADTEMEISKAIKGEKPYRFSRDAITALADELIKQDGNAFELDEIAVIDESGSEEETK